MIHHPGQTNADGNLTDCQSKSLMEAADDLRQRYREGNPTIGKFRVRGGGKAPGENLPCLVNDKTKDLGPSDVNPESRSRGPENHRIDSALAFSSRSAVVWILPWALLFTNPGIGILRSTSRWYTTSVPPSVGAKS